MMKKGMFVICGDSIEELERDLEAMKMVMASGKMCGIGGSSIEEVEQAMEIVRGFVEEEPEPEIEEEPSFEEMLLELLERKYR